MISAEELFTHGFDEFEVHEYLKGTSLILKCADWITNTELDVALGYARKIAKNKLYLKLTDNSFTMGKRLKVVVRG